MGIGESDSMESRLLSEGAAGSVRFEVPVMVRLLDVSTMLVPSISETVRVPEVERAALVSERDEVLELLGPTVMVGASLTALTVIATVSVVDEKAVAAPIELVSTLLPFVPEV